LPSLAGLRPDALLLFASYAYAEHFPALLTEAARETGAPVVIGCSAMGVIGMDRELERHPALALLGLSLPGAIVSTARITQSAIDADPEGVELATTLGIAPGDVDGWLLFADPFRLDGEGLIAALSAAYPGATISGGLASPSAEERRTWLFLDGEVYTDGAVLLGIGGDYEIVPVVSQGCDPIGEPWTVSGVQSSWIESISNRPALTVLAETVDGLAEDLRLRAQRNLLVGLAADEYRQHFLRGDFLIRNIVGADQTTGSIAVGAVPRVGQTIQFQVRDAATADLDLTLMLEQTRHRLGGRQPVAGVLCTCNGRGIGLFGSPHHDANAIARKFGALPVAGCFCAGEIGPIGGASHVHGFTASLALIVPK
jgi:small ligand-binding sensory domain FIST